MQTPETTVCEGVAGPSSAGPLARKTSGDTGDKSGDTSSGETSGDTSPLAPATSSTIPNPRKSRKRKASTDKVASSVENSASSTPADGIEKVCRKKVAKPARRKRKTHDEGPVANPESNCSVDNAVEKEQDQRLYKKCVNDPETFFGEWCKHRKYAMCITVEKISIKPGKCTESTVKNPFIADGYILTGIALCWGEDEAHYLRLDNVDHGKLKEQLGPEKSVIVPDVHRALSFLARPCNLNPAKCCWEEPTLANWLLDPDQREKGIPDLVKEWVPNPIDLFEEMKKNADAWKENKVSDEVACRQAVLLWKLQKALTNKLEEEKMDKLYIEHVVPVLGLHCKMVLNGLGCDPDNVLDAASRAMKDLEEDLKSDYKKYIDKWAGEEYDLSKNKVVNNLIEKMVAPLNLDCMPLEKAWTDPSLTKISKELCKRGVSDFADKIRDWRKVNSVKNKLKSMRKKSVGKLECEQDNGHNKHLTCSLGQTWAVTGRILPGRPNLQFMQKNFEVCTKPVITIKARSAFKPPPGTVFLSADYSQLELRIFAHLSKHPGLSKVFNKGGDVFRIMAAKWNDCPEQDVDDEKRSQTKQISYGILYGLGFKSIADELGIEEQKAKNMITKFKKAFPGMAVCKQRVINTARKSETCEVRTLLKRRRTLPDLSSQDKTAKRKAERQALHTIVQGSAADVFCTALLAMDKALGQELLRPRQQKEGGTYMVLQVHDEVLLEVREDAFDEVSKIVRNCMEGVKEKLKLSVPFPVRMRKGYTWGDMEDI